MWKAVQSLKARGLLLVSRRGGIRPTSESQPVGDPWPTAAMLRPKARWAQVCAQLRRELLAGSLAQGAPLPPMKAMCAVYDTCHSVIRRSLDALEDEGLITRSKRTYRPAGLARTGPTGTLVVVTPSSPTDIDLAGTSWSRALWQALERESSRQGLSLAVETFDPSRPEVSLSAAGLGERLRDRAVLGAAVLLGNYAYPLREQLADLLSGFHQPLAVIEEHGHYPLPPSLRQRPRCAVFSIGLAARDGELLGRHLLQLGHRRAVCFSVVKQSLWAQNRAAGVATAFADAGLGGQVANLTLPGYERFEDIFARIEQSPDYRQIADGVERFARRRLPSGERMGVFRGFLQIVPFMFTQFLPAEMEALFREAAGDRSATAWVAANDLVGIMALEFLRRSGVAAPGNVSVAGFDDSVESFRAGLTSYNFNVEAVVRAVLSHVTGSGVSQRGRPGGKSLDVYCPGYVVARRSTGPAPVAHRLT
jgi:DNA-binding LacI/PurR family transcriptional regulator